MDRDNVSVDYRKPTPWGFWSTIGFSSIISLIFILCQFIIVICFVAVATIKNPGIELDQLSNSLESNGLLLSITTCITAIVGIGLAILFAKLRKGITIKEYFCLYKISFGKILKWLLFLLILVAASDMFSFFVQRPIVPEFMINTYTTAYFIPLLWFALMVAAPLFEEIFFRGFLFVGVQNSKMGSIGAVIVTSLFWSIIHLQYDFYDITAIFMLGILLGTARVKTNSIYPPIIIHSLANLIATFEVIVYLKWYNF